MGWSSGKNVRGWYRKESVWGNQMEEEQQEDQK
jgi:hypothetical protein